MIEFGFALTQLKYFVKLKKLFTVLVEFELSWEKLTNYIFGTKLSGLSFT
jgi:hypothetical protein